MAPFRVSLLQPPPPVAAPPPPSPGAAAPTAVVQRRRLRSPTNSALFPSPPNSAHLRLAPAVAAHPRPPSTPAWSSRGRPAQAMATQGGNSVGPHHLSPSEIGWIFVKQYYTVWSRFPELAYKFYNSESTLGRADSGGALTSITTTNAINEHFLSTGLRGCTIQNVDSQLSLGGAIYISVAGIDIVKHRFSQLFLLAPQNGRYFVLNDMLRYIPEIPLNETNEALVKHPNGNTQIAPFPAEPGNRFIHGEVINPSAETTYVDVEVINPSVENISLNAEVMDPSVESIKMPEAAPAPPASAHKDGVKMSYASAVKGTQCAYIGKVKAPAPPASAHKDGVKTGLKTGSGILPSRTPRASGVKAGPRPGRGSAGPSWKAPHLSDRLGPTMLSPVLSPLAVSSPPAATPESPPLPRPLQSSSQEVWEAEQSKLLEDLKIKNLQMKEKLGSIKQEAQKRCDEFINLSVRPLREVSPCRKVNTVASLQELVEKEMINILNFAEASELKKLKGIKDNRAKAIIKRREEEEKFTKVEELWTSGIMKKDQFTQILSGLF